MTPLRCIVRNALKKASYSFRVACDNSAVGLLGSIMIKWKIMKAQLKGISYSFSAPMALPGTTAWPTTTSSSCFKTVGWDMRTVSISACMVMRTSWDG